LAAKYAAIDGELAALDEAFSNGAMSAPAGVNCMCVTLYELVG